jgi:hypothetical protein
MIEGHNLGFLNINIFGLAFIWHAWIPHCEGLMMATTGLDYPRPLFSKACRKFLKQIFE